MKTMNTPKATYSTVLNITPPPPPHYSMYFTENRDASTHDDWAFISMDSRIHLPSLDDDEQECGERRSFLFPSISLRSHKRVNSEETVENQILSMPYLSLRSSGTASFENSRGDEVDVRDNVVEFDDMITRGTKVENCIPELDDEDVVNNTFRPIASTEKRD